MSIPLDLTFWEILKHLDDKEVLKFLMVSKELGKLAGDYLKNWKIVDCGKNMKAAIYLSHLGYKVKLSCDYRKLTDVSTLANVHTLKLKGCWNVKDVSALRNVHTLDL